MAIDGGTPDRVMLRIPERRRSWNRSPGTPTALHAAAHDFLTSPMRKPLS
ncbi:MAG: hypothetical protein ABJB49_06765 [Nitrospirota bacterium]